MPELFLSIFNTSVAASWLILAIIVARPFLQKVSQEMTCLLWLLVAMRLLLPLDIKSNWSLVPSSTTINERVAKFDHNPTINSGLQIVDDAVNPTLSRIMEARDDASVNPLYFWVTFASYIWGAGVLILTAYALISSCLLKQRLHDAPKLTDHVYASAAIATPFVFGLLRPKIYLPADLSAGPKEFVTAHEREHLRHADNWWKALGFILTIVHWFNPLMWLAFALLGRDLETACDARVIKKLTFAERQKYAETLVDVSTVAPSFALAAPLAFAEVSVKSRVQQVLNYRRPTVWMLAVGVSICALVAVCFLTSPRQSSLIAASTSAADSEGVEVYTPSYKIYDHEYNFLLTFNPSARYSDEEIIAASQAVGQWCADLEGCQLEELTYSTDVTEMFNDLTFDSRQPQEFIAFKAAFTQAPPDPKLYEWSSGESVIHWLYLSRPPQGSWEIAF